MTERRPKVLAIDDDTIWLEQVPMILEEIADATCFDSIDQGLVAVSTNFYDVILLDLNFEGDTRTGLDVFMRIAATDNSAAVIVISGETRPDKLIQMMNAGVTQFIPKPSSPNAIREAVKDALHKREIRFRALNLASASTGGVQLIGSSPSMTRLREELSYIVESGAKDILLTGETGTGKEVVARTIATMADPAKRFVPINCGAISDGLAESELFGHVKGAFTGADRDRVSAFEVVGGGFVFLDEIADMPIHQQSKLLRVLQERKVQRVGSIDERAVSFRCISATNANLKDAIAKKSFREDLFYRIAKVEVKLPALRERVEDIPELVHYFLGKHQSGESFSIADSAMSLLQMYSWPGNVRQLQAVVDSIASRCMGGTVIRDVHVCQAIPELSKVQTSRSIRPFLGEKGAALISAEKQRFKHAIIEAKGDRTLAAQILKVSRATFFRRARELGLVSTRKSLQ